MTAVPSSRERILDEATQLFAERGYEGTSMADLAERVGLRKASLFHHFESKEVLYGAVLARLIQTVSGAIAVVGVAEGSFEARLDQLSDAITIVLGAQPFAARLLLRDVMDREPVAKDPLVERILQVLAAAELFVRAGQEAGAFAPVDAKQLLVTLVGLHFVPFALGNVVKGVLGVAPADAAFTEPRRVAVREQVRRLTLAKPR